MPIRPGDLKELENAKAGDTTGEGAACSAGENRSWNSRSGGNPVHC